MRPIRSAAEWRGIIVALGIGLVLTALVYRYPQIPKAASGAMLVVGILLILIAVVWLILPKTHREQIRAQFDWLPFLNANRAEHEETRAHVSKAVAQLQLPAKPPRIAVTASLGAPIFLIGGPQHHSKAWYRLTILNHGGTALFRVFITVSGEFALHAVITGQQPVWWNSETETKSLMEGQADDVHVGYIERSAPDNRVVAVVLSCDAHGMHQPCWLSLPTETTAHPVVEFDVLITAEPQIEGGPQTHRFRADSAGIMELGS
jgi:hypothetical protein